MSRITLRAPLESATESKVVDDAYRKLGIPSIKVRGVTGFPDREFFVRGGRPLIVEFKRPGEVLRPQQEFWVSRLQELDYLVEVHDSYEEAMLSLRRFTR